MKTINNRKRDRQRETRWQAYNIKMPDGTWFTKSDFDDLLSSQDFKCAICNTTNPGKKTWAVDHNHRTNIVRGILCSRCNLGLGLFGDNPDILKRSADYLLDAERLGSIYGRHCT